MQIKTCEEYVLNRIREQDEEIEKLNDEIDKLSNELDETYEKLVRLKYIIANYGERDIYTNSEQFCILVSNASYVSEDERGRFRELLNWFPDLPVKDYRTDKTEERTAEGDIA